MAVVLACRIDLVRMPSWWSNARPGERLIASLTVIAIAVGVPTAVLALRSLEVEPKPIPTNTTPAAGGKKEKDYGNGSSGPPKAAYLRTLKPGGDRPTGGYIRLDGRPYPNSIFYESTETPSTAEKCEHLPTPCRATSYMLEGHYETFTATFGITKFEGEIPGKWHWQVYADGEVAQEGMVPAGVTEVLNVPLKKAEILELVISGGVFQEHTFIWGDARVE
jgi:NPCBM/NEW2 domain